jgi:hypothetical protein
MMLVDRAVPGRIVEGSPVDDELRRLEEGIARTFPDGFDRAFAGRSDRQGIGGPARPSRTA